MCARAAVLEGVLVVRGGEGREPRHRRLLVLRLQQGVAQRRVLLLLRAEKMGPKSADFGHAGPEPTGLSLEWTKVGLDSTQLGPSSTDVW